jgi:hypothetical protein
MGYDGPDGSDVTAMRDEQWLAGRFEGNRARLTGIAYRMLGEPARLDALELSVLD